MASSRSLGRLTLDLIAKIGGFEQGMGKAERVAQDKARKIQRTFSSLQRTLAGVLGSIGVSTLIGSIVRNTAQAEQELAQLRAVLLSTGEAAGFNAQQLTKMAEDAARASTFSSGEIVQAQTRLLSYTNIVGKVFPQALQAAIDQSARLGISITQSAEIIGRALDNPSKNLDALSKQGFKFTNEQKALMRSLEAAGRTAEAQGMIIDALNESYAGAAQAARNTLGGSLAALKNSFADLLTVDGGLPHLTKEINNLADAISDPKVQSAIDRETTALIRNGTALIGFFREIGTEFGSGLRINWKDVFGINDELGALQRRLTDVDRALKNSPLGKPVPLILKTTEELQVMRAEIEASIALLQRGSGGPSTRGRYKGGDFVPLPPPPSEEFLKIEATLKEQIALFGNLGEAAKVAYQIQSGQLDALSAKEQQRILDLAKQIDALKAAAEEQKELDRMRRNFAEQERREYLRVQEAIQDDLEDAIRESNRRIEDVFGFTLDTILTEVGDSLKPVKDAFSVFADEAARNMQSAFAEYLFDPFDKGLKGMLKGFIDVIRRMVAEVAAARFFEGLGGVEGVSKGLGKLIPGFATGGSFKVGGSGGTDSQLIAFRATPGEMVDIRTPGQAKVGAPSVTIQNNVDARGATTDLIRALPTILAQNNAKVQQELIQWFNRRGYVQ